MVWVGFAVGLATLVALSPVAGDQLKVYGTVPPEETEPLSGVELPRQMMTSTPALTAGNVDTTRVPWSEPVPQALVALAVMV